MSENTDAFISHDFEMLFNEMESGFALHDLIFDTNGNPCDYRFIRVNKAFETLTGINANSLIGKTVLEVMPKTEPIWINRYGEVAKTGVPICFDEYSGYYSENYILDVLMQDNDAFFEFIENDMMETV